MSIKVLEDNPHPKQYKMVDGQFQHSVDYRTRTIYLEDYIRKGTLDELLTSLHKGNLLIGVFKCIVNMRGGLRFLCISTYTIQEKLIIYEIRPTGQQNHRSTFRLMEGVNEGGSGNLKMLHKLWGEAKSNDVDPR